VNKSQGDETVTKSNKWDLNGTYGSSFRQINQSQKGE
jgi:hypothetical protein